ncbi:MAG TPA: helix-turn-helix transcriptional regulator [Blastocatellia bacterium]|nr:helix-turn-helix transcriptional regulator [Blastocatellia bacterium]
MAEILSDYVRRMMKEKNLTFKQVEKRSRRSISTGTLNDIIQARNTNPTVAILKALARGLGVSEDEVFAVARGLRIDHQREYDESDIAALFYKYRQLSERNKKELRPILELIDHEIERRLSRQ